MSSRNVVVTNPGGLNLRGSGAVFFLARQFKCKVVIVAPNSQADAADILQLLTLGACKGTCLTLEAEGEQAEAALTALEELFAENFGQG